MKHQQNLPFAEWASWKVEESRRSMRFRSRKLKREQKKKREEERAGKEETFFSLPSPFIPCFCYRPHFLDELSRNRSLCRPEEKYAQSCIHNFELFPKAIFRFKKIRLIIVKGLNLGVI